MNIDEINGLIASTRWQWWYFVCYHWRWRFSCVFIQHGALSNGYMNVWLENQGGRRCGEVMSALIAFF